MKTAVKYTTVCESVPKGYTSWTRFYLARANRRAAVQHFLAACATIAALVLMYCFVGNVEAGL